MRRFVWLVTGLTAGIAIGAGVTSYAADKESPDTLYRKLEVLAEVLTAIENTIMSTL